MKDPAIQGPLFSEPSHLVWALKAVLGRWSSDELICAFGEKAEQCMRK